MICHGCSVRHIKDNTYRIKISDGKDISGKRIVYSKNIHCDTKKELQEKCANFFEEMKLKNNSKDSKNKVLFKDYTDKWLNMHCKSNLAPKTIERYKSMLNTHIVPQIGNMSLKDIKAIHITTLLTNISRKSNIKNVQDTKLSNNTIRKAFFIISRILSDATLDGLIEYNVCKDMKPPKQTIPDMHYYNEEETIKAIQLLQNEDLMYRTIVTLAITTGMRRCEIVGLHWNDIDFKENIIHIRRSAQYICGKEVFEKETKTTGSTRNIALTDTCKNLLTLLKNQQDNYKTLLKNKIITNDNIFTTETGKILNPDNVTKWFKKFIKRNNLPSLTFHGLRHTSATLMLTKGINIKEVGQQLGHSNIGTTNRYVHAIENNTKISMIFDDIYRNNVPQIVPSNKKEDKKISRRRFLNPRNNVFMTGA